MNDFMFDSVTMDYNLMTNNMIDNSMVNNLVVDNSASNDLMDITEMTKVLVINDSGVDDLMVDDFTSNSLTANDSMAYTHSTNIPVVTGDSIDTPMLNSPVGNGSTTNIFQGGNPLANDFMGSTANLPMNKSPASTETMADNSATTDRAASIFTPALREQLRRQMLFVDGPRKTEGVWLCAKCIKHLDRDGNEKLRKMAHSV